jgi:hypothetical protein
MILRTDAFDITFQSLNRRSARATSCRKKRYRTESDALDAAKRLRRRGYHHERAYACTAKNCGGWHLTTKREISSRAIGRYMSTTSWNLPEVS